MTESKVTGRARAADVIERYGKCLELVPTDPSFHDVSVGLYVKDGACTVWTFSRKPGVRERLQQIRDQLVALGGLTPVEGTTDQARFPCGHLHVRPVRFLMAQAVGKAKEYAQPGGDMSIKDSKTDLIISLSGGERDGRYVYEVVAQG